MIPWPSHYTIKLVIGFLIVAAIVFIKAVYNVHNESYQPETYRLQELQQMQSQKAVEYYNALYFKPMAKKSLYADTLKKEDYTDGQIFQ